MSATDTEDLARHLEQEAHGYHFFHLVRLLEKHMADRFPGTPALGGIGPAAKERVRLRPSFSFTFPASDIAGTRLSSDPERFEITTTFFGLGGVNSPLPRWYAQQLLWNEDEFPQQRAFLDIIHHRLLSLLYRGWLSHRYEYAFDGGGTDRLSRALLSMIGVTPDTPAEELGTEPARLLRYLGVLLLRTRPAAGLEHILSEELDLVDKLVVEPFPQRWVTLSRDQLFRLPSAPGQQGRIGARDGDIFLGMRRVDRMGLLQLRIGPVDRYDDLRRLAPGGLDHPRLLRLIRFYLRQPLDVRLRILVPLRLIEPLQLGKQVPVLLGPLAFCRSARHAGKDPVVFQFEMPLPTATPRKAAA